MLDDFVQDFYITVPTHFCLFLESGVFQISYLFDFFCFRQTLANTYSTARIICFSYIMLFQKTSFFAKLHFPNYSISHRFQIHCRIFFIMFITRPASILVLILSLNSERERAFRRAMLFGKWFVGLWVCGVMV